MQRSYRLVAFAAALGVAGAAAFVLTKRNSVSPDFSADDFKALIVQSMGEAAGARRLRQPSRSPAFHLLCRTYPRSRSPFRLGPRRSDCAVERGTVAFVP